MTVFSATASKELAIIVGASIGAAILVNLPTAFALVRLWVES